MHASFITTILLSLKTVHAEWQPEYNQQCRDDAGPPFLDDEAGKKYYDGQKVTPVLLADGSCAPRMRTACEEHNNKALNAYLEGPLSCNNEGWYCRIMPQEGWPPIGLTGDVNFGHCNRTESFEDAGYDRDGHCHGSSTDSTYYWWIRDHFNRQYNGRLRCCCGWYDGMKKDGTDLPASSFETPMYKRRIGNRCDYRRLVTETENINACRDANEDHGQGFDDTCPKNNKKCQIKTKLGCDPQFKSQIGKPIPEDDNMCWEIQNFGYSEGDGGNDDGGSEDSGDDGGECEDEVGKFFLKTKKNGKVKTKKCSWLAGKKDALIEKYCGIKEGKAPDGMDVAATLCRKTCETC